MDSWLSTNQLTDKERICARCLVPFSGQETLNIKNDGNVVVKYIECDNCGATLVLDVIRSEEIFGVSYD